MRILGLILLAATAATASAQTVPGQRPTFTAVTTYERCTKTTMFACGMRDAQGQVYGTAHERQMCSRLVLRPDGTFTSTDFTEHADGRYRIFAGKVRFTPATPDDATPPAAFELPLSPDATTLGDLTRIRR
jgi:hypothetical protein